MHRGLSVVEWLKLRPALSGSPGCTDLPLGQWSALGVGSGCIPMPRNPAVTFVLCLLAVLAAPGAVCDGLTATNLSNSTSCAEEDNINVPLRSSTWVQLSVRATHPAYPIACPVAGPISTRGFAAPRISPAAPHPVRPPVCCAAQTCPARPCPVTVSTSSACVETSTGGGPSPCGWRLEGRSIMGIVWS